MTIKTLTTQQAFEFFLKDKKLCEQALGDKELEEISQGIMSELFKQVQYFGIYQGETLQAIFNYQPTTNITCNLHFYLPSRLQKKGLVFRIVKHVEKYLKENTSFRRIVFTIPSGCRNVVEWFSRIGMPLEGIMERSIIWRGQLEDIYIYRYELYCSQIKNRESEELTCQQQ